METLPEVLLYEAVFLPESEISPTTNAMLWNTFTFFAMCCVTQSFCIWQRADDSYRLPKTVRPIRYNLTIEPILETNLSSSVFNGNIIIELIALEDTKNITIHARNLNISNDSILITKYNGSEITYLNTTTDEDRHFYIINLEKNLLKEEKYKLTIGKFSGDLKFDNVGFYLAKYADTVGTDRIFALTDSQPAGARKAFPCFDEPALKAKFIINIVRTEKYNSISNEQLAFTTNLGNGRFQDTYEETADMSTYLVAFSVSDYESTTIQNGKHSIFSKPEAIRNGKTDYVLSILDELLHILEDFTGINYTLNKLDIFTVPREYFEPGGMENWGLITISEDTLFYSNYTSTTYDLQKCTIFTSHELTHQWFGNLVTPAWWKYLWLSEGFATYLEYYISSILRPSWRLMDQFLLNTQQVVLEYDGYVINKPLNSDLEYAESLPSSVISYYKGACVIRMVEHFLTPEVFQRGIKIYLQNNQFSSVEPLDLYKAFQQAVDEANANYLLGNLTVAEILKTWDSTSGYPVVNVSRNYATGSVTFSQDKFFPRGKPIWYIPINYIVPSTSKQNDFKTTADFWLTKKADTQHNITTTSWLLINKLQTGYYRVNYDLKNWEHLTIFLIKDDFTTIPTLNRAQLINDAFNLAKWNYIPYEIPLNLSKYLVREKEYIPLTSFLNIVDNLNIMVASTDEYDIFKKYVIYLLHGVYNYLGLEEKVEDSQLDKLNRVNMFRWLCNFGLLECRNAALTKLHEWKSNNKTSFSADLEISVYCGAMQIGTTEDWNFLYGKYQSATDYKQKSRMFVSLGCAQNETILNNFLHIIFNTSNALSIMDRKTAFEKIVQSNYIGFQVALDYFTKHIVDSTEIFVKAKVTETLCKRITTLDQVNQLRKFQPLLQFRPNPVLSSCLIYANKNLDWIQKGYVEDISKWLIEVNQTFIENSGNTIL